MLACLFLTTGVASAAEKPNIVYIMADDLGWTDLACQGSKYYVTPHIDRLAAQGMRFTDAYTCGPNCQPTRAALMSGQYSPRTGVYTVGGIERFPWQTRPLKPVDNVTKLPLEKVALPQALKQAGYATGMFGKWHLGNDPEHHPGSRGFDEAIESSGRHFGFPTTPKQDVPEGAYLADWLTDRAVDFMTRHKDRPFFLYLPNFGVHSPHEAKPDQIARFKDKPAAGGHHDPVYAAMIASVDDSVGRVLATIQKLGLDDNTLVIFTADNGGVGGYAAAGVKKAAGITDNAPLRGGKGMLYEGGVRVAFIARRPGVIAAGATCSTPIITVDMYPTMLELAGATPPKDQPLDGRSLVPLLKSELRATRDRALFWHFPGYLGAGAGTWRTTPAGAVRRGDWKLLEFFEDNRLELYNLAQDLGQQHDLAKSEPERAKALHGELVAWRKELNAPLPTPNRAVAADDAKASDSPKPKKKRAKAKAK